MGPVEAAARSMEGGVPAEGRCARGAGARGGEDVARDLGGGVRDDERAAHDAAEGREGGGEGAQGEDLRGRAEADAAGMGGQDAQLAVEGGDEDVEREGGGAGAQAGGEAGLDGDEDEVRRALGEEAAEAGRGPDGEGGGAGLDGEAREDAAAVAEAGDAPGEVDGEADVGEVERQLDDVEGAEREWGVELDAEEAAAHGEPGGRGDPRVGRAEGRPGRGRAEPGAIPRAPLPPRPGPNAMPGIVSTPASGREVCAVCVDQLLSPLASLSLIFSISMWKPSLLMILVNWLR